MMRIFALFLFVTLSVSGQNYTTKANIPYYSKEVKDAYIAERCLLDIYYPTNTKNFATVVWFHGGGLTGGNKEIPEELKNKGFAVIGVGYRLSPKVPASQCIEDAAAAVAWVFGNIANYQGDANSVFVSGHSAGAYLASMVGLDKSWLQKHGVDANRIAGLIPFSGQMITHFAIRNEQNIPEKQPIIDKFAPLFHVRADAPPMLLITGDRELEMLGRYEENAYMLRMMKLIGHKNTKLFELDGYGHLMAEPAYPLLINEIRQILKKSKP